MQSPSLTPSHAPRGPTALLDRQEQVVVRLTRFGGPHGFELVEQPLPAAGPGQVRVRVLGASVQFTDVMMRQGKYPDLKEKPPLVLGYDLVGEIDQVGPGVSAFAAGDCVADLTMTENERTPRPRPSQLTPPARYAQISGLRQAQPRRY